MKNDALMHREGLKGFKITAPGIKIVCATQVSGTYNDLGARKKHNIFCVLYWLKLHTARG